MNGSEFDVYIMGDVVIKKSRGHPKTSDLSFIAEHSQLLSKDFPEIKPHYLIGDCLVCERVGGKRLDNRNMIDKRLGFQLKDFETRLSKAGYSLRDVSANNIRYFEHDGSFVFIDLGFLRRID